MERSQASTGRGITWPALLAVALLLLMVGPAPPAAAAAPGFDLSLAPAPANPGAAGMIQRVGDFLLAQGVIATKIDGTRAADGFYVARYVGGTGEPPRR